MEQDNYLELSFSSETPVERVTPNGEPYWEVISHAPGAIDLSLMHPTEGYPLLKDHNSTSEGAMGRALDVRVEGRCLRAKVRWSEADDVKSTKLKYKEKTLTSTSLGYDVIQDRWLPPGVDGLRTRLITKSRPFEFTVCPVGADGTVGNRRTLSNEERELLNAPHEGVDLPEEDITETEITVSETLEAVVSEPQETPVTETPIETSEEIQLEETPLEDTNSTIETPTETVTPVTTFMEITQLIPETSTTSTEAAIFDESRLKGTEIPDAEELFSYALDKGTRSLSSANTEYCRHLSGGDFSPVTETGRRNIMLPTRMFRASDPKTITPGVATQGGYATPRPLGELLTPLEETSLRQKLGIETINVSGVRGAIPILRRGDDAVCYDDETPNSALQGAIYDEIDYKLRGISFNGQASGFANLEGLMGAVINEGTTRIEAKINQQILFGAKVAKAQESMGIFPHPKIAHWSGNKAATPVTAQLTPKMITDVISWFADNDVENVSFVMANQFLNTWRISPIYSNSPITVLDPSNNFNGVYKCTGSKLMKDPAHAGFYTLAGGDFRQGVKVVQGMGVNVQTDASTKMFEDITRFTVRTYVDVLTVRPEVMMTWDWLSV